MQSTSTACASRAGKALTKRRAAPPCKETCGRSENVQFGEHLVPAHSASSFAGGWRCALRPGSTRGLESFSLQTATARHFKTVLRHAYDSAPPKRYPQPDFVKTWVCKVAQWKRGHRVRVSKTLSGGRPLPCRLTRMPTCCLFTLGQYAAAFPSLVCSEASCLDILPHEVGTTNLKHL